MVSTADKKKVNGIKHSFTFVQKINAFCFKQEGSFEEKTSNWASGRPPGKLVNVKYNLSAENI